MTTHLEIETLSNDNGKSLFRSQRVKLNGKEAITPLKALDPAKFRLNTRLNDGALDSMRCTKEWGRIAWNACKTTRTNMIVSPQRWQT